VKSNKNKLYMQHHAAEHKHSIHDLPLTAGIFDRDVEDVSSNRFNGGGERHLNAIELNSSGCLKSFLLLRQQQQQQAAAAASSTPLEEKL
jgi:hypothetical protein